ncbi:uncharacterized protein LOC126265928 [Aethina tumida]|uniref:uncharacterized protein LOC126265928 n=1 Tax=Aethina tumida TaxID=116153 RepID=UPI0021485A37|nr:uncharacterized protein LOC126265928 [Aethina tumida]
MSELFKYGRTSRGNKTLIYQGYKYMRHRTTASSVTHWYCVKRRTNNCKSIMHTKGEEIVQNPGEHTCNETTSPNQPDNVDKSTYIFEVEELPDSTEQLDAADPTIKLLVQEVAQSLLKKNLSIQEPDSSDSSLIKSKHQANLEINTSTKEPEKCRSRTQELVQVQLEENDELEVAAINITEREINLELVEEKIKEFILQVSNTQGLAEDENFPATPVSSGRRGSIESIDVDELCNIRLEVAQLNQQIKEEELNLIRMKARNEEECHQLRMKIMLHLFNNL